MSGSVMAVVLAEFSANRALHHVKRSLSVSDGEFPTRPRAARLKYLSA
jgi:hypothetical protein